LREIASGYNVLAKYASARRFFARLASEIFLSSLQTRVFQQPARTGAHLFEARDIFFQIVQF
jgi:hypothetical protein